MENLIYIYIKNIPLTKKGSISKYLQRGLGKRYIDLGLDNDEKMYLEMTLQNNIKCNINETDGSILIIFPNRRFTFNYDKKNLLDAMIDIVDNGRYM